MKFFRSLFAMLVLAFSFGTLNVFQILSLSIGLISKKQMKNFQFFLAEKCSDFCVWWLLNVFGFKPEFIFDDLPKNENALLICNHKAFADVVIIMHFAAIQRRVGHLKFFVKDTLKWLPGPGWSLWFYDSIFLKRQWDQDQKKIDKAFSNIKDNNLSFYIVSFPEGSRATETKILSSQKYMKEQQIEPLCYHLYPRTKGVITTIHQLRSKMDAVYDMTIDYNQKKPPSFWNFLSGLEPNYTLRVKRYPIASVPEDDQGLKQWITDRFREKDRHLSKN